MGHPTAAGSDGHGELLDDEPLVFQKSSHARRRPAKPKARRSFMREVPFLVLAALVLALLIKAFVVQAFYIPSGSMENTLRVGDRVLVNKLVYKFRDIHRGDIVVFNGLDSWTPEYQYKPPSNPVAKVVRWVGGTLGVSSAGEKDFIKRVIGVARRPRRVLQRRRPDHGQRRAAGRDQLPVSRATRRPPSRSTSPCPPGGCG